MPDTRTSKESCKVLMQPGMINFLRQSTINFKGLITAHSQITEVFHNCKVIGVLIREKERDSQVRLHTQISFSFTNKNICSGFGRYF